MPSTTWRGERKQRLAFSLTAALVLFGFGRGLALLKFGHRLLQHFRMADQIVAHDLLDLAALRLRKLVGLRRASGEANASNARKARGGQARIDWS